MPLWPGAALVGISLAVALGTDRDHFSAAGSRRHHRARRCWRRECADSGERCGATRGRCSSRAASLVVVTCWRASF